MRLSKGEDRTILHLPLELLLLYRKNKTESDAYLVHSHNSHISHPHRLLEKSLCSLIQIQSVQKVHAAQYRMCMLLST